MLAPNGVIDSGSIIRDHDVYRQRLQLQIERKGKQKSAECKRTFKPPRAQTQPLLYPKTVFFRENNRISLTEMDKPRLIKIL